MNFHGYTVDSSFVMADGVTIKWEGTGCGEFILGKKGGQTYFIKRNILTRRPDKSTPPKVYDLYMSQARELEEKQKRLNSLMAGLRWDKDFIVAEDENFWDENKFTTITVCVPKVMSNDQVRHDLPRISQNAFMALAKRSAQVMATLHARGVIHGDLKEKNFVIVNKGGDYFPYLIDFDSAYPKDQIPEPDDIGGTEGYQSPEILYYYEEMCDPAIITPATDIYTLALVWHNWWTSVFPLADIPTGDVGMAILSDKKVDLDAKFNIKIGDRCGNTVVSLMNWMIQKEPDKRPTAEQVFKVLCDELEVPVEYHCGGDSVPFDTTLWPPHEKAGTLIPLDELKAKYKGFKRANQGGGSDGLRYKITELSGDITIKTIDDLLKEGIVKISKAEITDTWPEDDIVLVDPTEIIAKGYASIEKIVLAFRKRYLITTLGGRTQDVGPTWLIANGLATKRPPNVTLSASDVPWPEHGSAYNPVSMDTLKIERIERIEVDGEHKYRLIRADRVTDNVPASNMKLMGLIIK